MKQKTIQLDEDYQIKNGIVMVYVLDDAKVFEDETYKGGKDERCDLCQKHDFILCQCEAYSWRPSKHYKLGQRAILVGFEDVNPDVLRRGGSPERFELLFDRPDGIGGNMDQNIKRFHGWRGTTNDSCCTAYGLREIVKIRELKNGTVAVTVGPDLVPDQD
jgi:hypothetical protein